MNVQFTSPFSTPSARVISWLAHEHCNTSLQLIRCFWPRMTFVCRWLLADGEFLTNPELLRVGQVRPDRASDSIESLPLPHHPKVARPVENGPARLRELG